MYNALIAVAAALLTFAGVFAVLGWVAAVIPSVGVLMLTFFLLSRRTGRLVEAELAKLPPLLQARKVDEAMAHLAHIQARYARWQPFLSGQIEAQRGMVAYMQMQFDQALPLLEAGTFRNWAAHVCIACIHYRRGRPDDAWKSFEAAIGVSPKEAIVWTIWANLLLRDNKRSEALAVLGRGVEAAPESALLKTLKTRVANKKKLDVKTFPESYYQFWPEDYARQALMRGRRSGPGPGQQPPVARPGARALRRR
jgi:tetratricopeptide (TPR) repeat protein